MNKNEPHEPYCGCLRCKSPAVTDPNTDDTGEWPALKLEPDTRPEPQGQGGCA